MLSACVTSCGVGLDGARTILRSNLGVTHRYLRVPRYWLELMTAEPTDDCFLQYILGTHGTPFRCSTSAMPFGKGHIRWSRGSPLIRDCQRTVGLNGQHIDKDDESRSEERRVGKECRSRWSPY